VPIVIRTLFAAAVLACLTAATPQQKEISPAETRRYQSDIDVLASDAMEGRGVGTKGLASAASFIEARLKSLGLAPAFGKSYRQSFPIKTGVTLAAGNRLDGVGDDDWIPLGFSSSGTFSGELAFVGYGITAPPIGYDDLEGIDLRGKVALMLRYEPQEKEEASPFDGRRPSRWSAVRYRVLKARERGAVAVVFVTGPLQDEPKNRIPPLVNDGPQSAAGIPVIQVRLSVAQRWLDQAGVNLESYQKLVDRDLIPRSVGSTGVRVSGNVALDTKTAEAQNVAGIIPGAGALASELVVVGAHYDHLGMGGQGSMRPNVVAIHNGADDNASGTVAVLMAAAQLRNQLATSKNHRTVLVALFSGEEVGLAGSGYLVTHSPVPLDRIRAMVNLDMVGRLRGRRLAALGADSAAEWTPALKKLAEEYDLDVATRGDGYGPSDQTSFYAQRIPVIHLFTGSHEQYHTPEDKPNTINAEGGARVAAFTASLVDELAVGTLNPTYVRAQSAPSMEGDSRGYGAYLGTIPDYTAMEDTSSNGVLIGDVRPGGPADLAGIRHGDRIVEMAGTRIANLYDMTYALQDHKPGDTITVVVLRDGQRTPLRATLGDRKDRGAGPAPSAPAPAQKAPAAATPDPHAIAPPAEPKEKPFTLPAFYEGRPGAAFVIGAGKPFDKTFPEETHLREIRQLTFGGENAEAYFSPDGKKVIFQSTPRGAQCDQEYIMDLGTGTTTRVSSGKGRTTCGYFRYPQGNRIIYSSTESSGSDCPPPPDRSHGYTWAVFDSYDIYEANLDGSNPRKLTTARGYDAEATWCHWGGKFVFTSDRDGDLDLYTMDEAGNTTRLTNTDGYDGGAFYSADCSEIVWRASRPKGPALDEYKSLLAKGLVRPTTVELWIMSADGTRQRQLTSNGAANFGPYFHPDGNRIIYSSNVGSSDGREFEIWMIDKRGGEPQRITFSPGFDGFPMFSPDGRYLAFASNRADPASHETNLFIARWEP
jgi:TolB protein